MINFLRHLFTPHHTNNHRAKILHPHIISFIIVFLLGLTFLLPTLQNKYPQVLGDSYSITTAELVSLTNQKRAEAGVAPLFYSENLSNAAQAKASNMFEKNYWAHVAPDGTTPWYFIKSSGYEYEYAGENLARGFDTSSEVVDAWMASPTHRENMLSPNYKDIGFAIAQGTLTGSDTVLVVQEFGSKYTQDGISVSESSSAGASPAPSLLSQLTPTPSVTISPSQNVVAAAVNKPLIDSKSATNGIALTILGLFLLILIFDLVIIERNKIARLVAHNLDHIIFLVVLILAVIIIGRGIIL